MAKNSLRVRIFWATWRGTSSREVSSKFRPFFEKEAARTEKRYDKITGSWQDKHRPVWILEFISSRNEVGFRHYTISDIFVYLAEGTSKRWAQMGPNYSRKTRKRRFGTYGFGGVAMRRGKRALRGRPRPGIAAREWHYQIADDLRRSKRLQRGMQEAMFDIAQEYGTFGRGGSAGLSKAAGRKMIKEQVIFEV